MPGNWGILECPTCGCIHAPPEQVATDCEAVIAELVCAGCKRPWEVRVELWRYYGIDEKLPSQAEDR